MRSEELHAKHEFIKANPERPAPWGQGILPTLDSANATCLGHNFPQRGGLVYLEVSTVTSSLQDAVALYVECSA